MFSFFFSSRRRHTRFDCDWSSDVCSSDLISMSDYALHMRIIAFLHQFYPKVRLTLHAGELAPGLVPYEGLCCHIRLAVEEAQAERIGHGVDVMYEDRPHELLKEIGRASCRGRV